MVELGKLGHRRCATDSATRTTNLCLRPRYVTAGAVIAFALICADVGFFDGLALARRADVNAVPGRAT